MLRFSAAAFSLCLLPSAMAAQVTAPFTPAEIQQLNALADQAKAAIERSDVRAAQRLTTDLQLGVYHHIRDTTPTAQSELQSLEAAPAANQAALYFQLSKLAVTAFDAGEYDKAERYANQLLTITPQMPATGNGVFFGNMIIGRVALRRDKNVQLAKLSLLAAGRTTGSPTLNSFGPNMSLAKDLITAGERDTVLEYFGLCRSFWKMGGDKLDAWTAMVKGGGMPEFGANLIYK